MWVIRVTKGIVVLFSFFLLATQSAALDPGKPIDRYLLREWGIEQGLPSDIINALAQTPDGFLWIGTQKGLLRYDGLTLEPVPLPDGLEGQSPDIRAFWVDSGGRLWIGENNHLLYLENNEIRYFPAQDGISLDRISSIYQDSEGSTWVATAHNYLFRLKDGKFTHFNNAHGIPTPEVGSLLEDKSGHLWVGNYTGGLLLYRNGKFSNYPLPIKGANPDGFYSVYHAYEDRQGVLWVCTNIGLLGIADICTGNERVVAHLTPADGLADSNVWFILEDDNGNLWVGTEKGLNRIRHDPAGKLLIDTLMPGSNAQVLLEDAEKNLWVGSFGSGLKQVRDGTFFTYWKDEKFPYWRLGLYAGADGRIIVGSSLGGVFRFDRNKDVFRPVWQVGNNIESEIEAIAEDADGWLWLGTLFRGIWRVKNGKTIHYTTESGLYSNGVLIIYRDSRDRLWIGYWGGGISCYRDGIFRHLPRYNGTDIGRAYAIREDKNKNIWIGHEKGLAMLPAGDFETPDIKTYLPGVKVTEIYEDSGGVFWVGTAAEGLKRFEKGQWVSFPPNNGLKDKKIYKILEDDRGNFWIGTQDGILKISKAELNDFAAGKIEQFQVTVFGLADGMLDTVCRTVANNAAIKTGTGELWFATHRGIAVVNPEKAYTNRYPPPVVIKEAIFNYESISLEAPGKSFTGIKDILFYFTAPSFASPERVKISYMLEGHDQAWNTIKYSSPRKAHYKKLPPGRYRFRVIACNSSGVWNNTGASFAFVLKPYFYQTPVFKIVAFITGLLIVIGSYLGLKKFLYDRKLRNKYRTSTLDPEKAEKCLENLQRLMEIDKLYRDEELSLDSLAGKLAIAPRYLSQVVNEQFNKNLRDYLNEYRVAEAKEFLARHGKNNHKILGIAFEVGFNSKEVFNRAFKKHTGITPSEFLKEHQAANNNKKPAPKPKG